MWNGQVSGKSNVHKKSITFCFSAIRFRGDVILQVSCYTLFKWIPTSVATILRSVSHRTPFRVYRKIGADNVKPSLSWERQVESLIASSAYQKWPTTNPWCTLMSLIKKLVVSHRFKVWEKAEVIEIRPTDTAYHCFTLVLLIIYSVCIRANLRATSEGTSY